MELNPINYYGFDISIDWDTEKDERIFVFTFTPRKNRFDHYHIEVSKETARELYKYLGDLIDDG